MAHVTFVHGMANKPPADGRDAAAARHDGDGRRRNAASESRAVSDRDVEGGACTVEGTR